MKFRAAKLLPHRGVTLFELTVAAGLLAVFVASAAQVVGAFAVGQRAIDRRALAQRAVDNLAEELQVVSLAALEKLLAQRQDLSPEQLAVRRLPTVVADQLPGASLEYSVADEAVPVAAKRVTLSLTWKNRHGRMTRPVRLTCWVFGTKETDR